MSALSKGEAPGPEASITKIVSANKLQAIGNFGIDSGDMAGMLIDEEDGMSSFQAAWLGAPGLRIAGGTDEILKNIIEPLNYYICDYKTHNRITQKMISLHNS